MNIFNSAKMERDAKIRRAKADARGLNDDPAAAERASHLAAMRAAAKERATGTDYAGEAWPLDAPQSAVDEEMDKMADDLDEELAKLEPVAKSPTKRGILESAIQTVADRGVPYGGVEDNFARIARHWNTHILNRHDIRVELDPADVAMMMALMKIARLENQPNHPDSWIDIAGYAACGGEITSR